MRSADIYFQNKMANMHKNVCYPYGGTPHHHCTLKNYVYNPLINISTCYQVCWLFLILVYNSSIKNYSLNLITYIHKGCKNHIVNHKDNHYQTYICVYIRQLSPSDRGLYQHTSHSKFLSNYDSNYISNSKHIRHDCCKHQNQPHTFCN